MNATEEFTIRIGEFEGARCPIIEDKKTGACFIFDKDASGHSQLMSILDRLSWQQRYDPKTFKAWAGKRPS